MYANYPSPAGDINADNAASLEQAWVLAFPGAVTMRSQPAGGVLYVGQSSLVTLDTN